MSLAFVVVRAATYATLFVGLLLVLLPARVLAWSGIVAPGRLGPAEWLGVAVAILGGVLALACVLAFAFVGRGTPAPFDPPRRLVVRGPYRFVRNPMYLGAAITLLGAATYYRSLALAAYAGVFLLATHAFVVTYEEPTLRATFPEDYVVYCGQVHRWRPRLR